MSNPISGSFVNKYRSNEGMEYINNTSAFNNDSQEDTIKRVLELKEKYPTLSIEEITSILTLHSKYVKIRHDMWTGECNDEIASEYASCLQNLCYLENLNNLE
jgi:hypothetical protein